MDAAHRLALELATALTGRAARLRHLCPRCGSDRHGVPQVVVGERTISASISRAPGMVAAAVALDGAIGIDLERSDAARFDGFDGVALHPAEPRPADLEAATRLWVRKEAVLKALGTGLRLDPRALRLTGPDNPPRVLAWPDPRPAEILQLRDLDAPDGYLAALAVIGGNGLAYTQVSIRAATSASV